MAWLAATETVEEAIDLRVGVGNMPAPEKKLTFTELRGMVGTALNRRGGAWNRAGQRGA
jgi:hypothetical protein